MRQFNNLPAPNIVLARWKTCMTDPIELRRLAAFASPIEWYEIPEAAKLNEELKLEISKLMAVSQGVRKSNILGWHSDPDLFHRAEKPFKTLCEIIGNCVLKTNRFNFPDLDHDSLKAVYNGWVNVNFKGAFNAPHTHAGFLWSGTYYVDIPKTDLPESGVIEFMDPRARLHANPIKGKKDHFLNPKARFSPEPGQLVVFPSYLLHWVYPNMSEQNRISVAFNMRIAGPGGG